MRSYHAKAVAIANVLKPDATVEQVRRLTDEQWAQLAERAGVGRPSPLARQDVLDLVADREAAQA